MVDKTKVHCLNQALKWHILIITIDFTVTILSYLNEILQSIYLSIVIEGICNWTVGTWEKVKRRKGKKMEKKGKREKGKGVK